MGICIISKFLLLLKTLKNHYVVLEYSCIVAYMLEMSLKSVILAMGEGNPENMCFLYNGMCSPCFSYQFDLSSVL